LTAFPVPQGTALAPTIRQFAFTIPGSRDNAMIVCQCNMLSDTAIRDAAVEHAPRRVSQVYACLGCRAKCGRCVATIVSILRETSHDAACQSAEALHAA
jgi:bacterioferritin-associated ferredoxin